MKNIILQHWSGDMPELTRLSVSNISKYAKQIGSTYKFIRGDMFHPNPNIPWAPIQKLYMLDPVFDEYDMVVMLDADMFARKGVTKNIMTDTTGVGVHGPVQQRLIKHMSTLVREADNTCSYWGGSIYRLDREMRKTLRAHLPKINIDSYCCRKFHGDEGIMHTLASHAKIKNNYIPNFEWNYPSFEKDVENSSIIHIRTKITPQGPKQPKIDNYNNLVERGII